MRVSVALALCCLCTLSFAADPAHASIRKTTNIPAEELGSALQTVAKDYDFQVLYRTEIVKDLRTQGAVGSLTSDEALGKVLKGTGLTYKYLDSNTVTIYPVSAGSSSSNPLPAPAGSAGDADTTGGGKKSSQDFRVAQVDQGKGSNAATVGNQSSQENSNPTSTGLSEIIVTAQKRDERIEDVPVSITAVSASSLQASNQVLLQDYYTTIPGLSLVGSTFGGQQTLAIRGLVTGDAVNPTVGVVIDDVPFGASTYIGGGQVVPDIDPSDLARVEVLRGPQGTLYGADSIGGLIKYVTVDPSTDALSGRIQGGTEQIYNENKVGYTVRGSINVPITDTLALRASGYYRLDQGFVDDDSHNQLGVNQGDSYGGRFAALWKPDDAFSVKLSALLQNTYADGTAAVDPSAGNLRQDFVVRDSAAWYTKVEAYSATVRAKFANVDFTSLTGYNRIISYNGEDASFFSYLTSPSPSMGGFGVAGATIAGVSPINKLSQELRLSSEFGRLDWLVGGFFTNERSNLDTEVLANDPTTGVAVGKLIDFFIPSTYKEYAGFVDLTYHFTDQFDIQLGGRESEIKQSSGSTDVGPFTGYFTGGCASPCIEPTVDSSANTFTYLVTPRFKITPDLMAYARLASGYRAGGPNATVVQGAPAQFNPDKTQDYELGVKADFLNRALSIDVSAYYIDWKDIQLSITNAQNINYNANAGQAKSQGLELSVQAHPTQGLTISAWTAWNDAELTQALAASTGFGPAGSRLPFSSRFSGSLSLNQEFPLTANWTGFVGGSESYVGSRAGNFEPTAVPPAPQLDREFFPAYAKLDLRAGTKYGSWSGNLYANNVADRRGSLNGNPANGTVIYIQPRTVGLFVAKDF